MPIHTMIIRSLGSLVAVSCLVLVACEKEDKGTSGDGSEGSASDSGNDSGNDSGASDPTEGGSGNDSGNSGNDSGNSGNDSGNSGNDSGNDSGDTQGQTCEGDWTLGSVPFSGDPTLGQACDGDVPKNCADGTFIKFGGTGECICIAECSSLGKSVGENCTDNGTWVCQQIEATNASMNSATVCVNKGWNLCTKDGGSSSSGDSNGESDGESNGESNGESADESESDSSACAPSGARCTFSDECCSGSCDFDECA